MGTGPKIQEADERGSDSGSSNWFCVEPSDAQPPLKSSASWSNSAFPLPTQQLKSIWDHGTELDRPTFKLVLNSVNTCSALEIPYPHNDEGTSKDGVRIEVWAIVGGRWDVRPPSTTSNWVGGKAVPGGADLPYIRPDGTEVLDAFYLLQADDVTVILLHNVGLTCLGKDGEEQKYRLTLTFTAPAIRGRTHV